MLRHLFVFIGPYAAWGFPYEGWAAKTGDVRTPSTSPLMDEVLSTEVFAWAGMDRMIQRDGIWHQRFFAAPRELRPGGPDRPMLFRTDHMNDGLLKPIIDPTDWTKLDHAAEGRWFRTAYAVELRRASELFGVKPKIRWGLVFEQD